jgi:hypothetical protein
VGHGIQIFEPFVLEYVPAGQSMQPTEPVRLENRPRSHDRHDVRPSAEV